MAMSAHYVKMAMVISMIRYERKKKKKKKKEKKKKKKTEDF